MRRTAGVLLTTLLFTAIGAGPAAGGKSESATVTVLHALPGFVADVYVNGQLTLDGFQPETATDPLSLPAGSYEIEVRDVGAAADSEPVLAWSGAIEGGQNLSIIARLTEEGQPELAIFENDVSSVSPGKSRLVVRHAAGAPTFRVFVDDRAKFDSLASGGEAAAQFRAGNHSIEFMLETSSDSVLGPADLRLSEGTAQIVYAVGSLEGESLDVMIQTISGLASSPSGVLTGDGGSAGTPHFPLWAVAVMAVLAMSAAWSIGSLVRQRRTS
jgi:hypothetical protein